MKSGGPRLAVTAASLLTCLGACLPDDPPVKGRLLHAGVGIGRVEFRAIEGQPWVQFEVRQSRAEGGMGAKHAVHLVNWQDPTQHRLLLPSRSDRKDWPRLEDATGALFYMTAERADGATGTSVGDLVRLSLTEGVRETITDVTSYVPQLDGYGTVARFYYRKRPVGAAESELHLRDLSGNDRNLGPVTGQTQFVGNEKFYYVAPGDGALTRLASINAEPEVLRTGVSSFLLHPNELFAVLTVSEEGQTRTLVRQMNTGAEVALPADRPARILGLQGSTLSFSEPARLDQPAVLHFLNIVNGEHRLYELPPELPNVTSLVGRAADYLLFDSTGRLTIFRPGAASPFEVTPLRPAAPSFSPDDRFLIFLEPEPPPPPPAISNTPTGALRVQSTDDWQGPSRLLSPRGASVPIQPVGFRVRQDDAQYPIFFWARYGFGTSDLYFANHETGDVLKVASAIGAIGIGDRHVLGVLRLTQDLTGDLVHRELNSGREQVIEHGVNDMQVAGFEGLGDLVAFVVRERMTSSPRNGLWATTLQPFAPNTAAAIATERAGNEPRPLRQWHMIERATLLEDEAHP